MPHLGRCVHPDAPGGLDLRPQGAGLEEPFDLALADPPYAQGEAQRLVGVFRKKPFATELWLEHPWRESLELPEWARTRRYGDTALSTIPSSPSAEDA